MTTKKFKVVLNVVQEQDAYGVQLDSIEVCDRTKIVSSEISVTQELCNEYAKKLTERARNQLIKDTDTGFA